MENEIGFESSGSLKASETSVDIPLIEIDAEIVTIPRTEDSKRLIESEEKNDAFHADLKIERGASVGEVFKLTNEESFIGRWDADNGIFPDVDLDAHDPEAKVSRKHARIVFLNGDYYVEDLGSTNGTFINRGRRLLPGNREALKNGDEIIVGKTFLRFTVA
jgi:FHA domain